VIRFIAAFAAHRVGWHCALNSCEADGMSMRATGPRSPGTARILTLALIACSLGMPSSSSGQGMSAILIDRHMTVGAGATVAATVGEIIARGEDAVVPHRLFAEDGVTKRTSNVAYRIFKLGLFDLPQEDLLMVANHEVFGHGARLRERFDAAIDYEIAVPAPYGDGGGATSFGLASSPPRRNGSPCARRGWKRTVSPPDSSRIARFWTGACGHAMRCGISSSNSTRSTTCWAPAMGPKNAATTSSVSSRITTLPQRSRVLTP
jgi:hypothetical protein